MGASEAILTAIEVATELRCSKAHAHKLVNGAVACVPPLPALRLGRRGRIREQSLMRRRYQKGTVKLAEIVAPINESTSIRRCGFAGC